MQGSGSMATRALFYLGETSGRCIFGNVHCQKTRLQILTSWRHSRGFKRNRDISKETEIANSNSLIGGPLSSRKLWKPLGFAIAFSGTTIVAASIWEYERIRKYTHRIINQFQSETQRRLSRTGWRGEAEKWWQSLSDGQRVFAPICFLNILVFVCWRIPALYSTMTKYFLANPSSSVTCWPMLLSAFSHYSLLHLVANMYVLHSFSTVGVSTLGKEQFTAFYLMGGVFSSLASHAYKTAFGMPGVSLGASGAIMGLVSFICMQYPEMMFSIAFLPMWAFTAGSVSISGPYNMAGLSAVLLVTLPRATIMQERKKNCKSGIAQALKGLMAMDTLGCVFGWRFMDHAAHLGGALFGIFWQTWGNSNIWQKREPIVKYWHNIRTPSRAN